MINFARFPFPTIFSVILHSSQMRVATYGGSNIFLHVLQFYFYYTVISLKDLSATAFSIFSYFNIGGFLLYFFNLSTFLLLLYSIFTILVLLSDIRFAFVAWNAYWAYLEGKRQYTRCDLLPILGGLLLKAVDRDPLIGSII